MVLVYGEKYGGVGTEDHNLKIVVPHMKASSKIIAYLKL